MYFLQDIGLVKIGKKGVNYVRKKSNEKKEKEKSKEKEKILGVAYMLSWESRWELT